MKPFRDSVDQVLQACAFAAKKHRDQRRKDKQTSPYINHPIALASVLKHEGGVDAPIVLTAALLHDTLEDTDTTPEEIEAQFGTEVLTVVLAVTDDKTLPKAERKRLQIEHATSASHEAKLVKLADKICNLRDLIESPPTDWSDARKAEYFSWANKVVEGLRGTNEKLEQLFDKIHAEGIRRYSQPV